MLACSCEGPGTEPESVDEPDSLKDTRGVREDYQLFTPRTATVSGDHVEQIRHSGRKHYYRIHRNFGPSPSQRFSTSSTF